VKSIRILLNGNTDDADNCHPFAQIDILPINTTNYIKTFDKTLHTKQYKNNIYLIVNRIIDIICKIPESVPFLTAVSTTDHPDYTDIVTSPIDLSIIKQKARDNDYDTLQSLLADIELLRNNCQLYCEKLYPELLILANILYNESISLCNLFQSELIEYNIDNDDINYAINNKINLETIICSNDDKIAIIEKSKDFYKNQNIISGSASRGIIIKNHIQVRIPHTLRSSLNLFLTSNCMIYLFILG
jgi:hypothetical protein